MHNARIAAPVFPPSSPNIPAPSSDPDLSTPEEPPDPRPAASRRHPAWRDVPQELWDDWRWQMRNAVRTTRQLVPLLGLDDETARELTELEGHFKLIIPPYYLSLIDPADPADPIRLQSVPSPLEMAQGAGTGIEDPLSEELDSPVPGLTHRYPDRVLLVTTPACSMYCRFCTRKRVTMQRNGWGGTGVEQRMIDYIASHPEVHDVVLSGGDALMLPLPRLRWFLEHLTAIQHVDVIRIGSRTPVTLPQRLLDDDLIDLLASSGKVWVQTHFNHPREVTPEAELACRRLVRAGIPVNNHSVLLRGVNDSVVTMRQLLRSLLRIKVRPYYLFHCDPIVGAGHFRTSIWKGMEIMEGLRGHISGLGIPNYVVDGLHGAGKIPLAPNYMLSASEDAVILRNAEGLIFRYDPRAGLPQSSARYESAGISRLLGDADAPPIVPQDTPRQRRRAEFLHN